MFLGAGGYDYNVKYVSYSILYTLVVLPYVPAVVQYDTYEYHTGWGKPYVRMKDIRLLPKVFFYFVCYYYVTRTVRVRCLSTVPGYWVHLCLVNTHIPFQSCTPLPRSVVYQVVCNV